MLLRGTFPSCSQTYPHFPPHPPLRQPLPWPLLPAGTWAQPEASTRAQGPVLEQIHLIFQSCSWAERGVVSSEDTGLGMRHGGCFRGKKELLNRQCCLKGGILVLSHALFSFILRMCLGVRGRV